MDSNVSEHSLADLFAELKSSPEGLSTQLAQERLIQFGKNSLKAPTRGKGLWLFFSQFKSPLIILLIFAAAISFSLGGHSDASIIFAIVLLSGTLGFFQERGALNALEKLLSLVAIKIGVFRDGALLDLFIEEIVPGDVVQLQAGDAVPADCHLIESKHLFAAEAALTGESFPVEKDPLTANLVFMGTSIISGSAKALVTQTGKNTRFGKIAEHVRFRPPETAFEIGVRRFSYFLMQVTMILVVLIFGFNLYFQRPLIDSFLFAIALAVGLTPQLLPAIIMVNLSHGARKMAKKRVVVKRLVSIENFGQMDILCTDKTGTITRGDLDLAAALSPLGKEACEEALRYGLVNASLQASYENPLDLAILKDREVEKGWEKIDEWPYDFSRKRVTVLARREGKLLAISKGAVPQIQEICSSAEIEGRIVSMDEARAQIQQVFEEESGEGHRLLGVAIKEQDHLDKEEGFIFIGFLRFLDPIKPGIAEVIENLKLHGVRLKILTGDNHLVALETASHIGLTHAHLATGAEVAAASDEALLHMVEKKDIFAEIEPNQKERIILALKKREHVVGYLGDGINDVSALHAADVGIAVDSGRDAAKEAADIILLAKDLSVLRAGVEEGRHTFANTIKYVYMNTSGTFGNMFSMAGASLFLPFLPLLPKQILLTNFLTDFPEMAIAGDSVDSETTRKPLRWDLSKIRKFMMVFGLISSIYDYLTFGVLLYWFRASIEIFRTGWFIESVVSATLVVLAIRTRRFALCSKPSKLLFFAVIAINALTLYLPSTSLGTLFGFTPLPLSFYALVFGIVALYLINVEIAKRFFFHGGAPFTLLFKKKIAN